MGQKKGLLTEQDKEFLIGELEYTGDHARQQRYQRREDIARRIRFGFEDFAFLFEHMDETDRKRIFDVDVPYDARLQDDLIETVAFLYLALEGKDESSMHPDKPRFVFEDILEAGIATGEVARRSDFGSRLLVDVLYNGVRVVDPDSVDLEHAVDKIARFEEHRLSIEELRGVMHYANMEGGYAALDELINERREELLEEDDDRVVQISRVKEHLEELEESGDPEE